MISHLAEAAAKDLLTIGIMHPNGACNLFDFLKRSNLTHIMPSHATFFTTTLVILAATLSPSRAETLTISSPKARQIIQRNAANSADVIVMGDWSGTALRLEARATVMPGGTNNGVSTDWVVIVNVPTNGPFTGILPNVSAGGWYRIELRAVDTDTNLLISTSADRVGIGDVFVTAGQSNAGCFGSPTQRPTDDRVSALTLVSGAWRFASDPQPDNSGGMGAGGSAWPILGSLLTQSNQVPVGFVGVAYGGSALSQWVPGTSYFRNLTNALQALGPYGVRSVLWHQGESDALANTSAITYAQMLSNIVVQSRMAAGWSVPWGIAEASFHPSATRAQEEPVAAGQRLCTYNTTNCFRGPRTDDLNLEGKLSDTVHFNTAGLTDHAQQWADALLGVEDLTPKNGDFESNLALADGVVNYGTRVIGWNRLNSARNGLASGLNGYFNPNASTYLNAADTNNGGVLPNMKGRHVGTLLASVTNNAFLQTLHAHLKPSTIYTFQAALGVRDSASVHGGYRLDLLANGVPLGPGAVGNVSTLNALAGGSSTGQFTVVSCVITSAVTVAPHQQLAISLTKIDGVGTYLDFDDLRVTSQLTPYGQWQMTNWGSLTAPESLPEADPDSDGLPNLIEFHVAGANPKSPDPMPNPSHVQVGSQDYWQMQLLKNPTATTGAIEFQMSYDLHNWFTPVSSGNGDLMVVNDAAQFTLQLRWSTTPTAFFRIVAQL